MNLHCPGRSPRRVSTAFGLQQLESRLALAVAEFDGGPSGTGTSWHEAANWVGDVLPGAGDDVVIVAPGVAEVVYSTGVGQIGSLNAQRPFRIIGGELRLPASAPANLAAPLVIGGGTLQGGRWTLAAGGSVVGQAGVLRAAEVVGDLSLTANPSVLTIQQGLRMAGRATIGTNGVLRYDTEQTWDGLDDAEFEIVGNGSTNATAAVSSQFNNPSIILTLGSDVMVRGTRFSMSGGSVVNRGVIRLEAGGQAFVSRVNNQGLIENLGGNLSLTNLTGEIANIQLAGPGANVSISGDFAHVGTTTIPAGAELSFVGNWINRGQVIIAGTWDIGGTTLASRLGDHSFTGGAGVIELRGTIISDRPEATIAAGGELRLRGGTLQFGTWRLLSPLTFNFSSNNTLDSVRIIGSIRDDGAANAELQVAGVLLLDGVITLSSAGATVRAQGGSIATVDGAEIRFDAPTTGPGVLLVATEVRQGVVIRGGHAGLQVDVFRGIVQADRAATSISLVGTLVHHGQIVASAGTVLLPSTSKMSGGGAIVVTGGEFIIEGEFNNAGRSRVFDATTGSWLVRAGGRLLGGVWTFDGAGVIFSGAIIQVTDVVWNGTHTFSGSSLVSFNGAFTLNASVTLAPGVTLLLSNLSMLSTAASGRIVAPSGSEVQLPGVIGAGITIESTGGVIAPRSQGSLGTRNEGLIRVDTPGAVMLLNAGFIENRGRIEVGAGATLAIATRIIGSGLITESGATIDFRTGAALDLEGTVMDLTPDVTWRLTSLQVVDGVIDTHLGAAFSVAGPDPGVLRLSSVTWSGTVTQPDLNLTLSEGSRLVGSFDLTGSSRVQFGNSAYVDGVMTFSGGLFQIDGVLHGSGSIRLNSPGVFFTILPTTEIRSQGTPAGFEIHVPANGPHQVRMSGTLRIGTGVTIRGGMMFVESSGDALLINDGAIISDIPGRTVSIDSRVTAINNGLIEARGGGHFNSAGATLLNRVNDALIGGTWRVGAGSTMTLGSLGRWVNQASVQIDGAMATFNSLGLLRVNAGELSLTGGAVVEFFGAAGAEWVNRGDVLIGASSRITVQGVANFEDAGIVRVIRAAAAVQPSLLVNGTLVAGGGLNAELASTDGLALGSRYDIVQATTLTGSFAALQTPPAVSGLSKQVLLAASSRVELLFTSRADIDNSGITDLEDLFGMLNRWFSDDTSADLDGNGAVAIEDLFVFLSVWFATRT